ncbi:hypothetical protein TPHA_0D04320 [Tetrapisispora phaffii CBS 4417]|uniref:Uncharacterized protein n=1 Tax=Tetrapisispora phaffii (strain ATCC 24235 / CBS 4417 / NBRC 1672 / NRRL Y-8282 / UCD 70-5) TaxID=1071381 RepID=G8BRZ1_TETPH|nr:hypothetical protein TPHA_0D04320 [Tetrapisispora phaffii CBS 4417]CCE63066.1 hypothetical protein TPHA_0D04320 [Tetrapisispora phaffii CBS 4417]
MRRALVRLPIGCLQVSKWQVLYGARRVPVQMFSTSKESSFDDRDLHQKMHQSKDEKKEMKVFHKNQKTLEKMESKKKRCHVGEKKPDMETLKKFGEDARVAQNRPDDGVY